MFISDFFAGHEMGISDTFFTAQTLLKKMANADMLHESSV
jgi:hypothetical protein